MGGSATASRCEIVSGPAKRPTDTPRHDGAARPSPPLHAPEQRFTGLTRPPLSHRHRRAHVPPHSLDHQRGGRQSDSPRGHGG